MLEGGMLFARLLDGTGGGRELDGTETTSYRPHEPGILWAHFDLNNPATADRLQTLPGMDSILCQALLAEEPRPRAVRHGNGLLVVLRGVNLNPGEDPEDMVAVRLWMEPGRIISVQRRKILSVKELLLMVDENRGPTDEANFLCTLIRLLTSRITDVVQRIDEAADTLEEQMDSSQPAELRRSIAHLRREAVHLRRYLSPQRDGLLQLQSDWVDWLHNSARLQLREIADRTSRLIEDLDSARERAAVCHEELTARVSEQLNQRMYMLAIVAGIFLPLGLITGLLGINVGGMPGVDSPAAFWIVTFILVTLGIGEILYFWKNRWF